MSNKQSPLQKALHKVDIYSWVDEEGDEVVSRENVEDILSEMELDMIKEQEEKDATS